MDNPKSLPSRTRALFQADFSDPNDTREKLKGLRAAAIRRPSLLTFVQILREGFENLPRIDDGLPENVAAVFTAMKEVAEMMMTPPIPGHKYHNNAHTLVVTANRLMLGLVGHKFLSEQGHGNEQFSNDALYQLARGCLICLNHDNGHNGRLNSSAMEREIYSYELVYPILRKHSFDDKERKFIERVTLLTDPKLPGEILKFGASLHGFNDNVLALPKIDLTKMIDEVQNLEARNRLQDLFDAVVKNPRLANEALLTKAADMAGSFGLSQEYWVLDGQNVKEELAIADGGALLKPEDENSFYKRQYWVLLNFVGAQRLPDETIKPSFMHRLPDYLFGDIADDINFIINQELPEGLITEVKDTLKKHVVRRGAPTALGYNLEPNL